LQLALGLLLRFIANMLICNGLVIAIIGSLLTLIATGAGQENDRFPAWWLLVMKNTENTSHPLWCLGKQPVQYFYGHELNAETSFVTGKPEC
jgi:hypothetical protein